MYSDCYQGNALYIFQIIAYTISLEDLLSEFPTTRDSYFVFGEEEEKKTEEEDDITSDPS